MILDPLAKATLEIIYGCESRHNLNLKDLENKFVYLELENYFPDTREAVFVTSDPNHIIKFNNIDYKYADLFKDQYGTEFKRFNKIRLILLRNICNTQLCNFICLVGKTNELSSTSVNFLNELMFYYSLFRTELSRLTTDEELRHQYRNVWREISLTIKSLIELNNIMFCHLLNKDSKVIITQEMNKLLIYFDKTI